MAFTNCYQDPAHAEAYSKLEFANTYYLAYRDIPSMVQKHVTGTQAVDFGCGTGRSTRFARQLGFDVIGIDISPEMIAKAQQLDPAGDYRLVHGADFGNLPSGCFDLVLSLFTFDNIPAPDKLPLFRSLRNLLKSTGKLISVVSSPEIYIHEWASFSTRDFPENRSAKPGEVVRIITTEFADARVAVDILCPGASYREIYAQAGLNVASTYEPLATGEEPYQWVNETKVAPWAIYVLEPSEVCA